MPNKLFAHAEAENHFVGVTDFVELCRLPLEGGRPYLVQARGVVGLEAGVIMLLRLDVCGFFGEVISAQQSSYINDHQQFVLTATATLPPRAVEAAQARRSHPVLPPTYWSRRSGHPTSRGTRSQ